jgi:DNA repair exonuclease SbcCD nuclease subunit
VKIIHTADIHLGSKINSFPKEVSIARKEEVRNSFKRMVDYANSNGVKAIIISGDLFDSDKPLVKDKEFFYSVVSNNPKIDFIYLKGNHDILGDAKQFDNLKTFTNEWSSYQYGNLLIFGVEMVKENATSIYSTLNLDGKYLNIVMLHGEVGDSSGLNKINLSNFTFEFIDLPVLNKVKPISGIALAFILNCGICRLI